jgi:TolA-binding protein
MAELKRPEKKKDFLKLGMNLLKNGQWEGARIIFGEYIEKFKGDPACAEAQFQIAESWFGEGKFQNSILEYQKVIEKYPKCNRVEEASYMLAVSFAQAGLPDEAKKLLEGFIAAYPDSKVAPRARKKLDEMKRAR